MLGQVLLKYGIPASKVNTLNLDPGAIGAAWKSGHIDATYIWAPVLQNLMADGGRVIITDTQLLASGDFDGDVIVVNNGFATKYPGAVVTILKAMICANNFANSRSPAALKMLSDTFSLPKSAFSTQNMLLPTVTEMQGPQFFGGSPPGLVTIVEKQAKFFHDQQLVPKVASAATITSAIDGSFLAKAVGAVGPNFSCT